MYGKLNSKVLLKIKRETRFQVGTGEEAQEEPFGRVIGSGPKSDSGLH